MSAQVTVFPSGSMAGECAIGVLRAAGFEVAGASGADEVVIDLSRSAGPGFTVSSGRTGSVISLDWCATATELVAAVRAVSAGTGSSTERLLSVVPAHPGPLTDRQRDVARLVAAGASNDAIGRALGISPHTARTHVQHLLGRLGVSHRAAVPQRLHDLGLEVG